MFTLVVMNTLTTLMKRSVTIRKQITDSLNSYGPQNFSCPKNVLNLPDQVSIGTLEFFDTVSLNTFTKFVMSSKPTNSQLDPIPTKLLKELFPVLGQPMLNIINCSLSSRCVPNSQNIAEIKPVLKKIIWILTY